MRDSWYDTAQICINGHIINESTISTPQHNKKYCDKCGEITITECLECKTPIQGFYHVERVIGGYDMESPSFCSNCGKPYPWIKNRIEAAQELVKEIDNLSKEERIILEQSIDDIVKDSPNSPVAALRFKKIMVKAGKAAADMFKDILVSVASEAAKKVIWGN